MNTQWYSVPVNGTAGLWVGRDRTYEVATLAADTLDAGTRAAEAGFILSDRVSPRPIDPETARLMPHADCYCTEEYRWPS